MTMSELKRKCDPITKELEKIEKDIKEMEKRLYGTKNEKRKR